MQVPSESVLELLNLKPLNRRKALNGAKQYNNNAGHGDSSTGSELKAVEEACREASRTVEPLERWEPASGF